MIRILSDSEKIFAVIHIETPESCCQVEIRPLPGAEAIVGPHGERIVQVVVTGTDGVVRTDTKTLYGPGWDIPKILDEIQKAKAEGRYEIGKIRNGVRRDVMRTGCDVKIHVLVDAESGRIKTHYVDKDWLKDCGDYECDRTC